MNKTSEIRKFCADWMGDSGLASPETTLNSESSVVSIITVCR